MAHVSQKNVTDVIQDKGKYREKRMDFSFEKPFRYGIGVHCLSTYDCIDGLVNSLGCAVFLHGHYIRY